MYKLYNVKWLYYPFGFNIIITLSCVYRLVGDCMAKVSEDFILKHFDEAIQKGYIKAYYQPIVRSITRNISDSEAFGQMGGSRDRHDLSHGFHSCS